MTKTQYWLLNITALLLGVFVLAHFFLVKLNTTSSQTLDRDRALVNSGRQVENVLDQLAKRIAIGSETDPRLKNILAQHSLKVTLEVDGKKKTYP